MLAYLIAILWAFACPNQTNASIGHNPPGQVHTLDDDTGGDTGHIPPPPPHP